MKPQFPAMVYKDVDKNGDVSEPSNQRTVHSLPELKGAIEDGWRTNPDEKVAAAEADEILERGTFAKVVARVLPKKR